MPVRIKPIQKLKPCILTLTSIENISNLVIRNFESITFAANDGVWEIYDEGDKENFFKYISDRAKLDSFVIKATDHNKSRALEVVFNEKQAKIHFSASPDHENWFEHFIIDVKKYLLPPTFSQRLVYLYGQHDYEFEIPFVIKIPIGPYASSTPYCLIILHKKPRSEFAENVKANLFSNLIWLILGVAFTVFAQWILRAYNISINPFK